MAILSSTQVDGHLRASGMVMGTHAGDYALCETGETTVEKTATVPGFVLTVGAHVRIKFKYRNAASNPTLNISGTGAKPIKYSGSVIGYSFYIKANAIIDFTYDGTNWEYSTALDFVSSLNGHTTNQVSLTPSDIGLGNVNNTSDAARPLTTAELGALGLKQDKFVAVISDSGTSGGTTLTQLQTAYAQNNDLAASRAEENGRLAFYNLAKVEYSNSTPTKFVFQRSYPDTLTSGGTSLNIRGAVEQWARTQSAWTQTIQTIEKVDKSASAASAVSAGTAGKATYDSAGNNIANTYEILANRNDLWMYVQDDAWMKIDSQGNTVDSGTLNYSNLYLDGVVLTAAKSLTYKTYRIVVRANFGVKGSKFAPMSAGDVTELTQYPKRALFTITLINTNNSAATVSVTAGGSFRPPSQGISYQNTYKGRVRIDGTLYGTQIDNAEYYINDWDPGWRYTVSIGSIPGNNSRTWLLWADEVDNGGGFLTHFVHMMTLK